MTMVQGHLQQQYFHKRTKTILLAENSYAAEVQKGSCPRNGANSFASAWS